MINISWDDRGFSKFCEVLLESIHKIFRYTLGNFEKFFLGITPKLFQIVGLFSVNISFQDDAIALRITLKR